MNVEQIKKIIDNDRSRRELILKYKKYYDNENDIIDTGVNPNSDDRDPLRNADNRISHNFHQLLVDEKASYMFTYPVLFDLDNNIEINKKVTMVLGDEFESVSKDLCIEASNCSNAFLHYWIDKDNNNKFEYASVKTEQVIPLYSNTLKRKLIGVYRYYESKIEDTEVVIFEHWTDTEFSKYTLKGRLSSISNSMYIPVEKVRHKFKAVPFIEFKNNNRQQSDLIKYKRLIDLYDKVVSGYANDLEDIQQIIYILENYGGEDLKEFLGDLKRFKAIKTESDGAGSSGGVKTLQIEIPVEARKNILDIVKKQIYESGQGLQQDIENFGNSSGIALKFFYRKLELKAGLTETEFKKGFNKLIRAILRHLNLDENINIQQTYTRNMISNDLENAQIAQYSSGIIPRKLILKNHPWVDDPELAEKMLEEEEGDKDPYDDIKVDNNE